MCAPASVTTLHAVFTVGALEAYLLSQALGIIGMAAAVFIGLWRGIKAAAKRAAAKVVVKEATTS